MGRIVRIEATPTGATTGWHHHAKKALVKRCDPQRDTPRTWDGIINNLLTLNTLGQFPDVPSIAGLRKDDNMDEISLQA